MLVLKQDAAFSGAASVTYFLKFGFQIERFGNESIVVREIPSLLQQADVNELWLEMCLADLNMFGSSEKLRAS